MTARTWRGLIFGLLLLVMILLAACQKQNQLQSQPAPPPQTQKQPSALDVAKVLKAAGIPFLDNVPGYKELAYPMDSSPGTSGSLIEVNNDAGILSSAVTATTHADVDITVFSSREKLEQARKRVEAMQQKLGDTSYFADVGCISVNLREDDGKPNKTVSLHADAIQKILNDKYGDSNQQAGDSSAAQPQLSPNEAKISRQEFGNDWPFTVDEGILACRGGAGVGEVVFTAKGATFAVNGIAKGTKKYRPIEEVWAKNPAVPGARKNIGPIIERGLKLCR